VFLKAKQAIPLSLHISFTSSSDHFSSVSSIMRFCFTIAFILAAIVLCAQQRADEIRKSIFFGGGSYDIDDYQIGELYHWLDSIPQLLEKYDIQLISHTDPIGGRSYNEWLSRMRSEAVHQILLRRSIPGYKISRKDWGLENPVYNNTSYHGMQLNRRVDVILYPVVF
jgi:outer membrane protein OmpA-like peptidoglycan-associated protein